MTHLEAERFVVGSQGPETDDEKTRERRETRVLQIEEHHKKQRRVKAKVQAQGAAEGAAEAKREAEGVVEAQVKFGYSDEDNPNRASSSSNNEQDSLDYDDEDSRQAFVLRKQRGLVSPGEIEERRCRKQEKAKVTHCTLYPDPLP